MTLSSHSETEIKRYYIVKMHSNKNLFFIVFFLPVSHSTFVHIFVIKDSKKSIYNYFYIQKCLVLKIKQIRYEI